MRINKITIGFVIQTWDTELKKWISQEFVAGDQVDYEEADGTSVEASDIWPDMSKPHLPFEMKSPAEDQPGARQFYVLQTTGDIEPQLHGPFLRPELRDERAVELRRQDPGKNNGLFQLDLSNPTELSAGPYGGSELE